MTRSKIESFCHRLPSLPYDYSALEPYIDTRSLQLHHEEHHAGYVCALNRLLTRAPELHGRSAEWLLHNLRKVPEELRGGVRDNAGGHLNHSLFWRAMAPPRSGGGTVIAGALADAIDDAFGTHAKFRSRFVEAGESLFGSGWVWLAVSANADGPLQVLSTAGHDNPLSKGYYPLLVNDIWEHAYYLSFQNRRADYLRGWWAVVNWKEAARRYACFQVASTKRRTAINRCNAEIVF